MIVQMDSWIIALIAALPMFLASRIAFEAQEIDWNEPDLVARVKITLI